MFCRFVNISFHFQRNSLLKLLIIVPTYNEVENITHLIAAIFHSTPTAHVLFVDDHSQDGTKDLIRAEMKTRPEQVFMLEREGKLGLGTAYLAGFEWGLKRDYEIFQEMDADLSHDPAMVPVFMEKAKTADVVIGSRYVEGGATKNWGVLRKAISLGGSLYARTILGISIKDLTGGYNLWKRSVLETIDLSDVKSEGYAFQIELKYRAFLKKFELTEYPITFVDRRAGYSKMSSAIVVEAMIRVIRLYFLLGRSR